MSRRAHSGIHSVVLLLIMIVGVAGCACSRLTASPPDPPQTTYTRPLHLEPAQQEGDAEKMAGAAGRVVDCETRVTGGIGRDTYEGAAMSSPQGALEAAASEVGYVGTATDFVREREEQTRVLYSYRVGSATKQAMIVVNGPTIDGGRTGWHAETWARCDLSEFPDAVLDAYSLDRWTDRDGRSVPTYELSSGAGPQHCDWQTATFLYLDNRTYIRNAPDDLVPDYVPDTYARDVSVPADATDTGYVRDGSHLWLAADLRFAYVGQQESAERWPAPNREFGCA